MRSRIAFLGVVCMSLFEACQPDDLMNQPGLGRPGQPTNVRNTDGRLGALPMDVPEPVGNPTTTAKVELGRDLFWDPILSGELDVACATCHHPDHGYADGLDLPIGVGGEGFGQNRLVGYTGFVGRNSPTVINSAYNGIDEDGFVVPENAPMFWDNRASGLEEQSLMPLHSFVEMRGNAYSENETLSKIIERLENIPEYQSQFVNAFGQGAITAGKISKALASFERTIVANNSPYDQYLRGDDNALTAQEIQGLNTFIGVGCIDCHNGPMLSDFELHVLGVRDNPKLNGTDTGDGTYAFRTPTLRNLRLTAPYMHSGELNSLQEVLQFYNRNNNNSQNPNVDDNELDQDLRRLRPINRQQSDAIISFLGALNDENFDHTVPVSVPSGLHPGGNIDNP